MQTEKSAGLPIDPNWTPAINIRPHHVAKHMPKNVVDYLKLYVIDYTQALYGVTRDSNYLKYYDQDVDGPTGALQDSLQLLQRQELKEHFLQQLKSLPDNCVAQLDLTPDGICQTCFTGKHCRATNFQAYGRRWNLVTQEEISLKKIHKKLIQKGFQLEVDFKITPASTELLDYSGENLWENKYPPQPITVQYNAILVRMRALRQLVNNNFEF